MKSEDKKDNINKFTSAMDDLKGILSKEGIDINPTSETNTSETDMDEIPVLHRLDKNNEQNLINKLSNKAEVTASSESEDDINDPVIICESTQSDLPILEGTISVIDENDSDTMNLDDYISDIDDDFDFIDDYAGSEKELEEKVKSITKPEDLYQFEQNEYQKLNLEKIKNSLKKSLSQKIEKYVDELKIKLHESMHAEIDELLKK